MTVIEQARETVVSDLLARVKAFDACVTLTPSDLYMRLALLERIERLVSK